MPDDQAKDAERYARFLQDAREADRQMQSSGEGYRADDVHAYLEAKVRGVAAPPLEPFVWRK